MLRLPFLPVSALIAGALCISLDSPPALGIADNNDFGAAIPVSALPYSNTQSTADATFEPNEPAPCGTIGATVWYAVSLSQSGMVKASTQGSSFDTVLAVYSGTMLNNLALVECNDDADAYTTSAVQFEAMQGITYYLQAGGYQGLTGELSISLLFAQAPTNDDFAAAVAVPFATTYTDSRSTLVATFEANEPGDICAPATGRTVWYSYNGQQSRLLDVTTAGSSFDTVLAVYTGSGLADLTNVACNDDTQTEITSAVRFVATAGTTYYLQVGGYLGDSGTTLLQVEVANGDSDGDGFTDNNETVHIGTGADDPCGFSGWPSDLQPAGFQPNALNIQDLSTFITPVRHLNTSPGDGAFSPRWDLVPGSISGKYINIADIAATITGRSGYPPMLNGARAFGQPCPFPP